LAVGNIVGSAISNILGAFSLGLLFHDKDKPIQFDRSSRIYSLVLLVLTTFVTPITYFSRRTIWLVCGSILIAFFVIYIGSVGRAISKGSLTAPEDSDDESSDEESTINVMERASARADENKDVLNGSALVDSTGPINQDSTSPTPGASHRKRRTLRYHLSYLFLGFLAICLAGYVLSHAATSITDEFGISDVLFGVVILSIATTLPEKFVAVMSGHRGHAGILVANTAGSNIFLLSLCFGIVMLDTSRRLERDNVNILELGVLWGSTLAFTATVWFGGRFCRWVGVGMLIAYIAFIVLEFTVIHGVAH
jgi:Ca2+/Na+ antiporter